MRSASGCTVRTVPAATPKVDRAWCAPAPGPRDWAARRHARAASRPPKALLTSPRARTNADIDEPRRPYIQLRAFPAPIATRFARQHRPSDPAPSTAFPRHPPAQAKKHQRPTKHRATEPFAHTWWPQNLNRRGGVGRDAPGELRRCRIVRRFSNANGCVQTPRRRQPDAEAAHSQQRQRFDQPPPAKKIKYVGSCGHIKA
ncbi:hypothetical protein ERJ75_000378000 [Trypanosoma vivax]|nr:hypothetical protein ERJ75_000378000 [Trypanosoma vivax]